MCCVQTCSIKENFQNLVTPIMCEIVHISGIEGMSLLVAFVQSTRGPSGASPAIWFRNLYVTLSISEYNEAQRYRLHDQMLGLTILHPASGAHL
jgi:hypothetical protein